MSPAFRDKMEHIIWEVYEEQCQYLCDTKKPRNLKVANWIHWIKVINDRFDASQQRNGQVNRTQDNLQDNPQQYLNIVGKGLDFERWWTGQDNREHRGGNSWCATIIRVFGIMVTCFLT